MSKKIIDWCRQNNIENFSIDNGLINVKGNVELVIEGNVEELPYPFGIITGYFDISHSASLKSFNNFPSIVDSLYIECCNFTSLIGCPTVKNRFNCNRNKITSLIGGPKNVVSYYCSENKLDSLKGLLSVKNLSCEYNNIETLEYCPNDIVNLYISNNKIYSLKYCPCTLHDLYINENRLESLEYCPNINNDLDISNMPSLLSLKGIGTVKGDIYLDDRLIKDKYYLMYRIKRKLLYG